MRTSVTRACLNVVGNVPDVSEAIITFVTATVTVGAMDWNKLVGEGSKWACSRKKKLRHTALSERGE